MGETIVHSERDAQSDDASRLRARGFRKAGVPDPTRYATSPEA